LKAKKGDDIIPNIDLPVDAKESIVNSGAFSLLEVELQMEVSHIYEVIKRASIFLTQMRDFQLSPALAMTTRDKIFSTIASNFWSQVQHLQKYIPQLVQKLGKEYISEGEEVAMPNISDESNQIDNKILLKIAESSKTLVQMAKSQRRDSLISIGAVVLAIWSLAFAIRSFDPTEAGDRGAGGLFLIGLLVGLIALAHLDKNFTKRHDNHTKFEKVTGGTDVGDIIYFEESVGGILYKIKGEIARKEQNGNSFRLDFKTMSGLGHISFTADATEYGCIFTHIEKFGLGNPYHRWHSGIF
jgi:hypothetical protein